MISSLGAVLLNLRAISAPAGPAQAANVKFTASGVVSSAGLGYQLGESVSFDWVVVDAVSAVPPGSAQNGTFAWVQSFSANPLLYYSFVGTGISGSLNTSLPPSNGLTIFNNPAASFGADNRYWAGSLASSIVQGIGSRPIQMRLALLHLI